MKLIKETIEAVLFDLDGTLMETDDEMVRKLTVFFSWFRLRDPERLSRRIVMKAETPVNGLISFFDRLGMDHAVLALFGTNKPGKRRVGSSHPMMEGVGEMLGLLKEKFRLGLVTTNSTADTVHFLEEKGIRFFFDVVVTRTSVKRLKPHPEPLLYAVAQLGVLPGRCIMVGDTTPDMKAAVAAGVIPVGVLCGFGTREELLKAGALEVLEHTRFVAQLLGAS
ncbi:MAG: HAD family hydrolase [Bacteroidota bacterium]|jgi:HAD superfamily hydrolase (TIGR01509 family)|nr:HAD family hydrolase [Prolixibacteraceae bacterium]MDI9562581.1 HAD family hydrolase [Bacteroidota bacterium]NLT00208.1 HAD family hydrolase [Bacteroidales bacterium]HNZ69312.1 HAD family hydrolase [Prolixibacteraceae bacterium]HOC87410.1 HAD family hydrolase [Prolixibacteraceae bacterium]